MQTYEIYEDLKKRCGGVINIGVAGPSGAGKSTLINGVVDMLDFSYVENNENAAETLLKTVVNGEQTVIRFCERSLNENMASGQLLNVDLFFLVTCDKSLCQGDRTAVEDAEKDAVEKIKKTGKPFVIVLNCEDVTADEVKALAENVQKKYGCSVICTNCAALKKEDVNELFERSVFEFPVCGFNVDIPEWMAVLSKENSAIEELLERVKKCAYNVSKIKDCSAFDSMLLNCKYWQENVSVNLDVSTGVATLKVFAKEGIFYEMLSEIAGEEIADESQLTSYIKTASEAKVCYAKIKDALECAKVNGYGIVEPEDGDMSLQTPTVIRQGSTVGIKLKATAPSYHIVKVDVCGEVSPIMGNAAQSEEMVKNVMEGFEKNPEETWQTNLFGKSLKSMVKDGLSGKVVSMQEDTKIKMRKAITRMVNEGKGGVICILL
ncbi:MAG: hypothetical protein J6B04_01560 [Clostridia bacterium]|nr:hypothetical protein [Clostridia bacterium]